ncbi:MAG TPA: SGNH/GDSL hydrolase family protein [Baekduia sp.]|nr:SGNH/GDSL hydrolase family protein [Baekduia sp.]
MGPVLGLGDSIMCGPEEGAFGVPPRAWPQWLAEAMDRPFHRLAQPGALAREVSGGLLGRARDDYALACVGVGTNDVRSPDWDSGSFTTALATILDALDGRAARVCVASVPCDLGRPPAGSKVGDLNRILRREAASRGATVVDLDAFAGWRWLFPDAVHPTALGQLEIARRAARALGLAASPAALTSVRIGWAADARYALTRQIPHLARDWRRRAVERNV